MKIAQVSPLFESVPPKLYGGTERVVSYLTEELVALGHDVTLFASGDAVTKAKLEPCCENSLRLDKTCIDSLAHHILMLEKVYERAHEFDIIHNHNDYLAYPFARDSETPTITTLHGRLDIPDLIPLYREFSEMPVVSISNSQRKPLPFANWITTVYHGLPLDLYPFSDAPEEYFSFIGRISPEKGLDSAIEIAKQVGIPLKIAAKVDVVNREYYEKTIKPLLSHPLIQYIGEIGEEEKAEFLGKSLAMLFPIDWEEPFGLCMIESMACGTPVLARRRGSIPEVIDEGITGYIFRDIEEGIRALKKTAKIDRKRCRQQFEERFSARRMALDYVRVYEKIIEKKRALLPQ